MVLICRFGFDESSIERLPPTVNPTANQPARLPQAIADPQEQHNLLRPAVFSGAPTGIELTYCLEQIYLFKTLSQPKREQFYCS